MLDPIINDNFQRVSDSEQGARTDLPIPTRAGNRQGILLVEGCEQTCVRRGADVAAPDHENEFGRVDDLWLPSRGAVVRVPISSVVRIAADRDYVKIHAIDGCFLLRATMSSLEKRLGPGRFVRIHRSAIIAMEQVAALRHVGNGSWMVVDREGSNHPIGRHFLKSVRCRLGVLRE